MFIPPELWCSVVFLFLNHKEYIPLLHTSREWFRLATFSSQNSPLRVPEDLPDIQTAISYVKSSSHRIQSIQLGPGIFSLPAKPSPPRGNPTTTQLTLVRELLL